MKVIVYTSGIKTTSQMKAVLNKRLAYALGRFENSIRSVTARLEDVNGPRGGRDIQCRITVKKARGGEVIGAVTRESVSQAISAAGKVVARALRRGLKKPLARRRSKK